MGPSLETNWVKLTPGFRIFPYPACHYCADRIPKIRRRPVDYIVSCKNMDSGFGRVPGRESHSGQIFCCVDALAVKGHLDRVDKDLLGWWLCEWQVKSGGLNGWSEKLPDVCYSWWVLSSLTMIGWVRWIDQEKLIEFIPNCQDTEMVMCQL
ncbi:hypothetical protein MLD38_016005 [Melastoma candidum]|uniref:Uncharacterized protein n=1 Tax=Melastoma candidum TaxID=119954 RepID=A0ACB9RH97_9MYRT|nr:hypothetical protein MLD38_016005 [Melastoma candidum]